MTTTDDKRKEDQKIKEAQEETARRLREAIEKRKKQKWSKFSLAPVFQILW